MKLRFLTSVMILLLISFISNAQTNFKNNRSIITKGYYSIGDHSAKLPAAAIKTFPLPTQPVIQKGYYSVESNRKKLSASYGIDVPKNRGRVTKGYYGVGDNYKKLE